MTEQDELASAIRDAVTQGSYVLPWHRLYEHERCKWLDAAAAARRIVHEQELQPVKRTARVVTAVRRSERAAS